jgi:hypothetical protein
MHWGEHDEAMADNAFGWAEAVSSQTSVTPGYNDRESRFSEDVPLPAPNGSQEMLAGAANAPPLHEPQLLLR